MKKHIVVLGASRGFGREAARRFAAQGWKVSVGARNQKLLQENVLGIRALGQTISGHSVDVTDHAQVQTFFESCTAEFGTPEVVVFAVGTFGPFGKTEEINSADWIKSISTNLIGAFFVLQESIKEMKKNGGGRIIMLSGGGATSPMPNISAYAASKAGLVRLVESVAMEVSDENIFINALAPGVMQTEMVDELLTQGANKVPLEYLEKMQGLRNSGEDSTEVAFSLLEFLATNQVPDLTGRLIAAKWDDWATWTNETPLFQDKNLFTLRRVI